ncbi:glycosyltransferase family 4 protein [Candidatus Parcubacteria bacterium]|nr:glycosyltransferase family 4 protein [Candidatus Parcubacteria bacterium]
MKIYHIEFAKIGTDISGGEICMLKNIKYFKSKGLKNILLTTENGRYTYKKLGLCEDEFLEYKIIKAYHHEKKYHIFILYLLRIIKSVKLVKNIAVKDDDVLVCSSEFFPDSIPFYFLAKKNKKAKLFYWFHMLAPNIFKGYEGHFTGKFQMPKLTIIHYKLNQLLYRQLTFSSGIILTVNFYYKNILRKKYFKNKIYVIKKFGGIDALNIKQENKKYDLIWLGRFHQQKGLFELLKIVDILRKKKKDIKIVILGGANDKIKKAFFKKIKAKNLGKHIEYKGVITGGERFKYMKQSKIFLMPSLYESFGIVNLEAMKCGLPVVAYNLPVFDVFKKGMIKVDILDNKKMADEILRLLKDSEYYKKISNEALKFSSEFSWEKTGEEIYSLLTSNSE